MHLALGRPSSDGAPRDKIADVLRRDHVEKLTAHGHAHIVHVEQELARDAQTVVDPEASVEIRIVDQPFPAHGGARLLEIHAHADEKLPAEALLHVEKLAGILLSRLHVVYRAWPDDDDDAIVGPMQDAMNCMSRVRDGIRRV